MLLFSSPPVPPPRPARYATKQIEPSAICGKYVGSHRMTCTIVSQVNIHKKLSRMCRLLQKHTRSDEHNAFVEPALGTTSDHVIRLLFTHVLLPDCLRDLACA